MNTLLKILFICCMVYLPVTIHCQSLSHNTAQPIIKLDADKPGKKITISQGRVFSLTLPGHVDGGYLFDKPHYNTSLLQLVKHKEYPVAANNRLGQPGQTTWQFIALKKGISLLKITATRPWAGGGSVILFTDIIIVK